MDPEATLTSALSALTDDNAADAAEYLQAYANWRRRGGFEPRNGDERARQMRARLLSLLTVETRADVLTPEHVVSIVAAAMRARDARLRELINECAGRNASADVENLRQRRYGHDDAMMAVARALAASSAFMQAVPTYTVEKFTADCMGVQS